MRQHLVRLSIVLACAVALTAAYQSTKSPQTMAGAAKYFLNGLSPDQKAKATFAFSNEERLNWHFIPRERKGLPFREMDTAQKALAHSFMSTGLSPRGYQKATLINSLEDILKQQEKNNKAPLRRDPEGYFFSVFGEPGDSGNWGWRVEGHHISLNFTLSGGKVIATSPMFFGSNPQEIKWGPRQGQRTLPREEDLGRELVLALDAKQKTTAVLTGETPKDIISFNKRKADPLDPKGLVAKQMNKKQSDILMSLIEEYVGNLPDDLANVRIEGVKKAGLDKVTFAWAGGTDKGQGHYYRVQGPTFLIEYDCTQDNGNHIHSVWRDYNGDFGTDVLAAHYRQAPHGTAVAGR
jgi:hypothetical protein